MWAQEVAQGGPGGQRIQEELHLMNSSFVATGLPIIFCLMLPQCVDFFLGLILSREGSRERGFFLAVETSSIVNISTNYNPFIKDLGDEISFLSNMGISP